MSIPNSTIFLLIFSMSIFLPSVKSISFNFSDKFDENAENSIRRQGDAFFSGQAIWLTKNDRTTDINYSTGRVVYKEKLLLWDPTTRNLSDFSTHFSFSINSLNNVTTGDGLTFFLLSDSSLLPNDIGGGFLGLYTKRRAFNTSVYSFVAVEVDTFKNEWDTTRSDHVGINIGSPKSSSYSTSSSRFKDGRTVSASINYNSSTKNLSVLLTYDFHRLASVWYVVDLMDILPEKVDIGFSGSTGDRAEIHKILSWNFTSNLVESTRPIAPAESPFSARKPQSPITPGVSTKKNMTGQIVALIVVVGAIAAISGVIWFVIWRKKVRKLGVQEQSNNDESVEYEFEKEEGPKRFTSNELIFATNNFAKEGKLGQGGFGEVYKGLLNYEEVAIKKVSAGSSQGKKEYISEVQIISRLRHRNLIQLVGWCHNKHGEFLLVYKLMPNGSLDSHLYSQEKFLAWPVRYKIALGLASALLYLHEEWEQCVVHRDIKPSNVMLDSDYEAKLGDFGLARFVDHEIGSQTTILAGTMGYLAPESVTTGKTRKESDVYSFGIVALEIACGRRPVEMREEGRVILVEWVWELYGKRMILEAADKRLNMEFEEKEMKQLMIVGLWCAHPDQKLRPSIRQAINVLKFEASLPLLPSSMPVLTFSVPSINMYSSTSSIEGYTDITTNSSSIPSSSGSASTSLLK